MYKNHNDAFESSHDSFGVSFASSPFDSSTSSDSSSLSWADDSMILTPASTPRRGSLDFQTAITISHSSPQNLYTSHTYDDADNLSTIACMSQEDIMLAFLNDARMVDNHANLGHYAIQAQTIGQPVNFYNDSPSDTGIQRPQDYQQQLHVLELRHQQQSYSNVSAQSSTTSSPVDGDFVIPSQTFHDDFNNLQPQMQIKLDFGSYDSPATSFDPDISDYSDDSVYYNSPTGGSRDSHHWMQPYNMAESSPTTVDSLRQPIRQPNFDLRSTSAALQRMQISSFGHDGIGARKTKKEIKREQREMCKGINASIQTEAEERCNWKGCTAKFHRREHLKRHQKCHMKLPPQFFCNFCDKPRAFSRTDNLKSHVKLHIKHRASARTPYHPDALAFYEGLSCKVRKNKSASELNRHTKQEVKRESLFGGTRSRTNL